MPRTGSGAFTRVHDWTADADAGIDIRADRMDEDSDDIAQALSDSISRDGQTTTTAIVPFAEGASFGGASRFDSGGKLGVGMTPTNIVDITQTQNASSIVRLLNANSGTAASARLQLSNGTSLGSLVQYGTGFTASGLIRQNGTLLGASGAGGLTLSSSVSELYFATDDTERMRLQGGQLLVGRSTPRANVIHCMTTSTASNYTFAAQQGNAGGHTLLLEFPDNAPNDTTARFILGTDSSAERFIVYSTGGVVNATNSYGAISDQKVKQDISLADSQWDDVKALGDIVSKFHLKNDPGGPLQIGLIAQQVQEISPGLVFSSPDRGPDGELTGEETLGVHYSVFFMKAAKALSEAQHRIEALEAEVAALKAAP